MEYKNGQSAYELAALRKTIYGPIDLCRIMLDCNQRYLAFSPSLDGPEAGQRDLKSRVGVGSDKCKIKD